MQASERNIVVLNSVKQLKLQLACATKSVAICAPNLAKFIDFSHAFQLTFAQSQQFLGKDFKYAVFCAIDDEADESDKIDENKLNFCLQSLVILSGTILSGGTLFLILPPQYESKIDLNSVKFNHNQAIACPNFFTWFTHNLNKYQQLNNFPKKQENRWQYLSSSEITLNLEQQKILNDILKSKYKYDCIISKRGRGKSTLLHFLIKNLLNQSSQSSIILCASAKNIFHKSQNLINEFTQLKFLAPDDLAAQIKHDPLKFNDKILIIDEAAKLSQWLLQQIISPFKQVILASTIDSYEGSGSGFWLKTLANLGWNKNIHFLTKAQRFQANDNLEQFMDSLIFDDFASLLTQISAKKINHLQHKISASKINYSILDVSSQNLLNNSFAQFYSLLKTAHYRTSTNDLRRFLDGEKQLLAKAQVNHEVIASLCGYFEGNSQDNELNLAITRGQRRPNGNLFAQAIAYNLGLTQALNLKSFRISRIAVSDQYRRLKIATNLISYIKQSVKQAHEIDFISVSFSHNPQIEQFWLSLGFEIIFISQKREKSTALFSAMAMLALSDAGKELLGQAKVKFKRNFTTNFSGKLNSEDLSDLHNFAYFNTSLANIILPLQRLLASLTLDDLSTHFSLLQGFDLRSKQQISFNYQKPPALILQKLRLELKNFLTIYEKI